MAWRAGVSRFAVELSSSQARSAVEKHHGDVGEWIVFSHRGHVSSFEARRSASMRSDAGCGALPLAFAQRDGHCLQTTL